MNEKFMLTNKIAVNLYEKLKDNPIFDYHCHLDPREIYEDKPFEDITQMWLSGDHYKWRLMRANGISEKYITGEATSKEKFEAWAKTLAKSFGNPLYHWSHLEMFRVFGIEDHITESNWEVIYDEMNEIIKQRQLSPRKMIDLSKVTFIGTTDSPLDTLYWHEQIAQDNSISTRVVPTFRPDQAFVEHSDFAKFTQELAKITGRSVKSFETFVLALEDRIKYFANHGCRASDISFSEIIYIEDDQVDLDQIFQKAFNQQELSRQEVLIWQTRLFDELCRLYTKYDFVTQVHFGARRNNNYHYFTLAGPDSGFDSIGDQVNLAANLNRCLDRLSQSNQLPKMIFYNLNPSYNTILANNLANFQANEDGIAGKLQFGAAWWFADSELGMIDQLNVLREQGILANFIGMLTDSRSFLSYQRHEYFRRILCDQVGMWVETGKIPKDEKLLIDFIQGIAYDNAVKYFEEVK